jgi:hypothetical protein
MSSQTKDHNTTAPQRSPAPAGWGVALMIHLAVTFLPVFSSDWVERRAERMAARRPGDR